MQWRRFLRVILEPAKDPLRDSFGLSIERVVALRVRLHEQLVALRSRAARLEDPAFEVQIRELQSEHDKLVEIERRVRGEIDNQRARRDLLDARQTAAHAQDRLQDLVIALDDAHAHATALAETLFDNESRSPKGAPDNETKLIF